jgi:hypothetical protein
MFVKWLQECISEEYLRSIGRTWAGGAIDTVTARAAADTVLRARGQTAAALAVAISKELRDPKARSPVS